MRKHPGRSTIKLPKDPNNFQNQPSFNSIKLSMNLPWESDFPSCVRKHPRRSPVLLSREFFHHFETWVEICNCPTATSKWTDPLQQSAANHHRHQHRLWSCTWYPVLDYWARTALGGGAMLGAQSPSTKKGNIEKLINNADLKQLFHFRNNWKGL